jgi:putative serine/threonine protein kinase
MKFKDIKQEIEKLEKIGEGWRGNIFKGEYKGKKIAFKVPSEPIHKHSILKEGEILKIVNKAGIGGKLLLKGEDFIAYEFIEGKELRHVINKENAKKIFSQILEQARKLDKLQITKEEMHRPHANILVNKNLEVFLIDFERAKKSKKPKNITQFVQFLITGGTEFLGNFDKKEAINLMRNYKNNQSDENFLKIKEFFKL